MPTIWTYGHRSPHGLEYNTLWGELWGTEMGPRGGDEVNRVLPGRNYGWPLTSKGVHYNGHPVDGRGLGIDFDIDDLEQPVVDLTPSVAVSSFVFYDGDAFPRWRNHLLVGSLKASDLYRFAFEDGVVGERETVIEDLARIRDVEVGPQGNIFLLLEHDAGGQIVRMSAVGSLGACAVDPRRGRPCGVPSSSHGAAANRHGRRQASPLRARAVPARRGRPCGVPCRSKLVAERWNESQVSKTLGASCTP